jgi:1-acyl-sn-glycerol-3-phosphate acyltransferase
MFPEGTRSRDGSIGRMRSGAAAIAEQHDVPIVPIFVKGTHDAMPPGRNWPKRLRGRFRISRRHKVEIHFGPPIQAGEGENRHDVMERVRSFLEVEARNGAAPAPDKIPAAV